MPRRHDITACRHRIAAIMVVVAMTAPAAAQTLPGDADALVTRPMISMERWKEDWSVLADPTLPREPMDGLKYIPLSADSQDYLSLGADLRERVETLDALSFGVGGQAGDTYLLDRLQLHADLHLDEWQAFVELEDDRTAGKIVITPADSDRADLEQAFVAHVGPLGDGVLKLRAGRQEFGFDLQRFVAVRDGPNVRQSYDALWADYEIGDWRLISFGSHPTQNRDGAAFDDYSAHDLSLDGFRVERRNIGPGSLAVYYLRYGNDRARLATASGRERRNALDAHYDATMGPVSVDVEAMGQQGDIGGRSILAWAFGSRTAYAFSRFAWNPTLVLQVDAASGSSSHGTVGTFNPLFPNGYYFPLSSLETYANLIHVKPILTLAPTPTLSLQLGLGLQWRETTRDAVYTIPVQPVAGTAGRGSLWTTSYLQLDVIRTIGPHLAISGEAVRYRVGDTIRQAGGRSPTYAELQVALAW